MVRFLTFDNTTEVDKKKYVYFVECRKIIIDVQLYPIKVVMVVNATFNNISAISWRSVLLMEETRVPGENHQSTTSH